MRSALIVFHRWLALLVTVLILALGITGSALVFEGAMDRALHPGLWHVTPAAATLSLDTLMARARSAAGKATVTGITLPPAADRAVMFQAGAQQIFVDPYTGAVRGTRTIDEW